jgi:hypothetical protein
MQLASLAYEEITSPGRSCAFPGSYPGKDEEDNGSTTVPNEALREMMQAMTSLHAELAAVKARLRSSARRWIS